MRDTIQTYLHDLVYDLAATDSEIALLIVLLVVCAIVADAVSLAAKKKGKQAGIGKPSKALRVDGSEVLPAKDYVSHMQALAGKPDAVIKEDGYFIPVEYKPLAKKIRDRYVAQILVYMRLVEEFEGKKPPYGYLILGPNKRRVKIENSETRQNWLQHLLNDMQNYLENDIPVKPDPHPNKCRRCTARESCKSKADPIQRDRVVTINQKTG